MKLWRAAPLLLGAVLLGGCAKEPEVIIHASEGKGLTAEAIDREPLALLPSGAVGIAYLDAPQLFASEFGAKLLELCNKLVPIPAAAGFDPKRDLERAYVGVYSMQGLDVAGVAIGKFDPAAIERSGESSGQTAVGVPIVRSTYAKRTLYTARNVGLAVLTSRTVLIGNETGIRRALDRMDAGHVRVTIPTWAADLLDQPRAPMAVALNLRAHPVTEATRGSYPFLEGLHQVRLLGNFQAPGINLAGTGVYDDDAAAQRGDAALRGSYATLQSVGVLSSWLGIPQPVERLETQLQGKEVKFVAGMDGSAVATLIDLAIRAVPAAGSAAQP